MGTETELLKLAEEKFGKLNEAEVKFFTATAKSEEADYESSNGEENNPENADKWENDRVLHAEKIKWLCTDSEAVKFVTHKGIQIIGARIEGKLNLQFAVMYFPLAFFVCAFEKEINLQYAQIQALHLGGTHTGPIAADGLEVKGFVYLRDGFKAEGEVRLLGATIGGNLECDNSKFINPEEDRRTLFADGLNVKGSVCLRNGFKAEGEVRLPGANIGENLDCIKGEFINPGKNALFADGINVKGNVILRDDFKAQGAVRLLGATIGGNLDCSRNPSIKTKAGEFINTVGRAINADGINVKRSVFLRNGFKAEGKISLETAVINGSFVYTGVESPEKAILSLRSTKIGVLWDEKKSWPKKGNLNLHGLVYDSLDEEAPKDAKSRIKWLRLNEGKEFSPQPYEQLAEVLKRSGHEKDAKEVYIAKNEDRIKHGPKLGIFKEVLYRLFGLTMGYGYKPLNMLWAMFLFLLIGWFVFGFGAKYGLITPAQGWAYKTDATGVNVLKGEYPAFNFWVYSIDTFIPLVDLQQSKYWLPNAKMGNTYESIIKLKFINPTWMQIKSGGAIRVYLWFHIAFGWILTTLFVVGLTGLVRK